MAGRPVLQHCALWRAYFPPIREEGEQRLRLLAEAVVEVQALERELVQEPALGRAQELVQARVVLRERALEPREADLPPAHPLPFHWGLPFPAAVQ